MTDLIETIDGFYESQDPFLLRYSLHNQEAEKAILGAVLTKGDMFQHVAGWMDPLHFEDGKHQAIFQAMAGLFATQDPIDRVSVASRLRESGQYDQAGGVPYLIDLMAHELAVGCALGGGESAMRYNGRKVIDLARRRAFVQAADELTESACDLSQTDYAEAAQAWLMSLTEAYVLEEKADTGSVLDRALLNLESKLTTPGGVTGLSTGFRSLDRATHGFQRHQLITLAARPGCGKSALALNIAAHVAMQECKPVLFVSLEMTGEELMERLVRSTSGSESEFSLMVKAREEIRQHEKRLILDDAAGQTLTTIQSKILKAKQAHPDLGLIVIDHIGLIASDPNARKNTPKAYEIQEITSRLKVLAKSTQTPVLQLCQMNRQVEGRQDKKPMLSDLRDSGSVEMDSDLVMFINIERTPERQATGNATLTIAKQRDGALSEIPLLYVPHLTKFKERSNGVVW
jgi:replicative DNA helicase